jgi:hypothetical protein
MMNDKRLAALDFKSEIADSAGCFLGRMDASVTAVVTPLSHEWLNCYGESRQT